VLIFAITLHWFPLSGGYSVCRRSAGTRLLSSPARCITPDLPALTIVIASWADG